MRWSTIVLTATALVLIPEWAEAGERLEPGGAEFLRNKRPNSGKDYYVVHTGQSNQCSIVAGRFGDPPVGAIDDKPYADEKYAKRALATFPDCKGGETETDEVTDKKHKKK
jgi:hypothetical protein